MCVCEYARMYVRTYVHVYVYVRIYVYILVYMQGLQNILNRKTVKRILQI